MRLLPVRARRWRYRLRASFLLSLILLLNVRAPQLLRLKNIWLSFVGSASVQNVSARDRHPCHSHFIDTCRQFSTPPTFDKKQLVQSWPIPLKIDGLRQAIAEHNAAQIKACNGQTANPRLLVFHCIQPNRPGSVECPALGDGIRGLTMAFILAVVEKRSFFMYTPGWIAFEDFFPFKQNWRLEKCPALFDDRTRNATEQKLVNYYMGEDPSCEKLDKLGLTGSSERIVSMVSNQVADCWYNLLRKTGLRIDQRNDESVMSLVFETLFEFPGQRLTGMLEAFLRSENIDLERSVCLHIRSGAFTGVDAGCFYKNIDDVWRCARAMELAAEPLSGLKDKTWVLIGDSDLHKQMALDYISNCSDPLFAKDTSRKRIVDTSTFDDLKNTMRASTAEIQSRLFFDLLILSRCRHMVATHSGYSGLAAALHFDWSERRFVRVMKMDKPTNNINELCMPVKAY